MEKEFAGRVSVERVFRHVMVCALGTSALAGAGLRPHGGGSPASDLRHDKGGVWCFRLGCCVEVCFFFF